MAAEEKIMFRRLKAIPQVVSTIGTMVMTVWQAYPIGFLGMLLLQLLQGLLPVGTAWITKLLFDSLAHSLGVHVVATTGMIVLPRMVILLLV